MSRINKNVVAVYGHGILGRAVFALDFDSQDIPSELYDRFRAVCGLARPTGVTEKRYPWEVKQPGTPNQVEVWDLFLQAIRCFALQPETGGATPPAIGPRGRDWWYNQSISSGLFYYDYFMKETLALLHQGIIPDWFKSTLRGDAVIFAQDPDANVNDGITLDIRLSPLFLQRMLFEWAWESSLTYLYIKIDEVATNDPSGEVVLAFHVVDADTFEPATVTWNTKPALGSLVATHTFTPADEGTWMCIPTLGARSLCMKFANEANPGGFVYIFRIYATGHGEVLWREYVAEKI